MLPVQNCFTWSNSSYEQNMREKHFKYHPYIEVSAQESLCKAEKRTEI